MKQSRTRILAKRRRWTLVWDQYKSVRIARARIKYAQKEGSKR